MSNSFRAKTAKGEAGDPIWKLKDGPRPSGIEYRLASDLVRGLTGDDPNIGATTLPFKIFSFRRDFQKSAASTNLLFWVCRQLAPTMSRTLEGLAAELNLDPDRPARAYEAIDQGFELLKRTGVVNDFKVEDQAVTFHKNQSWPFDKDADALAAPAQPPEKKGKA